MSEDRSPHRIQIAGDYPFCRMIYNQFGDHAGFELVRPAITTDMLAVEVKLSKPDILVLQADHYSVDCLEALGELESPPRVVVVSPDYDPDLILAREHDFTWTTLLPEMVASPLFMTVLESVAGGYTYHAASPDAAKAYHFTPFELCVLQLMVVGFDTARLIMQLERKAGTIYYTQRCIRHKLNVETKEQAIVTAIQEGVVSILERRGDPLAESQAA